jgi:glycosyltransferase involved in cell wall biosynthesis
MSKVKVLYVIDRIMVGGAEQVFIDILNLMQGRVELFVLLVSQTEPLQLSRLKGLATVYQTNRKSKASFPTILKISKILRGVDIIHVHLRPTLKYINFIKLICFIRKPLVFHDHYGEIEIDYKPPTFFCKILKPDFYIGVSNGLCNWAISSWGFERENTVCLINLSRGTLNQKDLRGKYELQKDFVLVGNIKPVKNQKFAIELISKLGGVSLDLIGSIQDEEYSKNSIRLSEINLIDNEINAISLLHNYKFGLCTSISESGPLVVLEYFVSGLPFIAYKTGGISEILYKYVPEYFMNDFILDNWIERYKGLEKDYKRIPEELIAKVLKTEFNNEVYANKLMDIYKKCTKADS